MSDTSQASHITDHPFRPEPGGAWWARCKCGISEAAHRDRHSDAPPVTLAAPARHRDHADEVKPLDCPACFTEAHRD